MRCDSEIGLLGAKIVQLDAAPVLQPNIGIDPDINVVTGEVLRQERADREGAVVEFTAAPSFGDIEVPSRYNTLSNPRRHPVALCRCQAEIGRASCRERVCQYVEI